MEPSKISKNSISLGTMDGTAATELIPLVRIASDGTLPIKEEVEISETQFQEQTFDRIEAKYPDQPVEAENRSTIISEQCHKVTSAPFPVQHENSKQIKFQKVDNKTGSNDYERNSETTKNYACSVGLHNAIKSTRKKNHTCSVCAKSCRTRSMLEVHMNFHTGSRPYACTLCPKRFAGADNLRQHELTHDPLSKQHRKAPKKDHICSVCAKAYRYKYRLESHMNTHTGSRPYACTTCPKRFSWPGSFRRHKMICFPRLKCALCEKSFKSKAVLDSHLNFHRDESPSNCERCSKSFRSTGELLSHMKTHLDDGKYECSLCNTKCRNTSVRRNHEKTHSSGPKEFQCEKCKMYFRLVDQYRSHLEENKCKGSSQETNVYTNQATGKPFRCMKCDDASFTSIQLLIRHKAQIHPKMNHICSLCAKAYRWRYELDIHMNSHTGNQPYACPICHERFATPKRLHRHKLTHGLSAKAETSSGFKCTLCEKSFKSKAGLVGHMNCHRGERAFIFDMYPKSCKRKDTEQIKFQKVDNKTGPNDYETNSETTKDHACSVRPHNGIKSARGKNHTCSVCAKSYRSRSNLEAHMNFHTGSRPYACTFCPRRFAGPDNLRQHKLTHNPLSKQHRKPAKKDHLCSVCAKAYRYKYQLESHMHSHTTFPRLKCTLCEKSFKSKAGLIGHMNFHRDESPSNSERCSKSFRSMKTHLDDGKYECSLCNTKCRNTSVRRKHERTHSIGPKEFQCEKCKMYFRLVDQYRSHLEENKCKGSSQETKVDSNQAIGKPFRCMKCDDASFTSIQLLIRHKAQIHPKMKNICSLCAKAYRYRCELDIHMNSHTGNQPYVCPICHERFATPKRLYRHKLTHGLSAKAETSSGFKCTLCEKCFSSKNELSSHMNCHRDEGPFTFDIYPKSCKRKDILSPHKTTRLDDNKCECTLCCKKITEKSRRINENCLRYQCAICARCYKSKDRYRSHFEDNKCKATSQESQDVERNHNSEQQIQAHGEIENAGSNVKSQGSDAFEKKYECEECNKKFICKRNLNFHLQSHLKSSST